MSQSQLSPQKEQEIASKILERAELAQMTRQLKLGLSKVATPKKASRDAKSKVRVSPVKFSIPKVHTEQYRISPLKRERNPEEHIDNDHEQSPLKVHKRPSTPNGAEPKARRKSIKHDRDDIPEIAVPRTPRAAQDNDVGADLLMYLATSPYTSKQQNQLPIVSGNGKMKIPTTPSYLSQGPNGDAIRLSHIKAHTTSPHSAFKVPNHTTGTTLGGTPSNISELMESPSVALYMSPSPNKRKVSGTGPQTTLAIPSTPSRELRSSHLLKTPNFNMGDYVHNLFSPSPRVTSTSYHDTKKD
ncbi:LAFE_0G18162g1_1 [Lachancea fermentati]|uniref:LAFE_0G18162g1_1 n=1 Tax=Lachancea fermentati TaxID=4955 RepID=A0A1G4MIV8_LACFM|nr:LAFE_0G18162g1_1 [Lachancea fermentati]